MQSRVMHPAASAAPKMQPTAALQATFKLPRPGSSNSCPESLLAPRLSPVSRMRLSQAAATLRSLRVRTLLRFLRACASSATM